ncbi:MAG TPA: nuclear transport factor 2 family protein [Oryzihumus sp.]|nr:nuclear transport factor 2 family protein [Oryzihumus sp.]
MTDFTQLAQSYIQTWNETDATARRAAVERLWAPTGRYVDPIVDVQGHEQIAATIGAVQERFAGMAFELLGGVDSHHAQARFQWGLGPAGQEPLVVGFDVLEVGQDGRVETVLGFLDRVPARV